jgi:hypothetical protein
MCFQLCSFEKKTKRLYIHNLQQEIEEAGSPKMPQNDLKSDGTTRKVEDNIQ